MNLQIGDILSVELFAHTRHFFVYVGDSEVIDWGPWDDISWMGGKGQVSIKKLFTSGSTYQWLGRNGKLQEIILERRTGTPKDTIYEQIEKMTTGIDYHLIHRNCEHFAYYVTGEVARSEQSVSHLFADHTPFSSQAVIYNLIQLKDAFLRARFCGSARLSRKDFEQAVYVGQLDDGYYIYHLDHWAGGQHLYATSVLKSEDFESSYNSVILAQHGALVGRGEMFGIIRQIQGC